MESEWSFNVWKYGLVGLPFPKRGGKASRMLDGSGALPILTNWTNGVGQAVAVNLPGEVFAEFYLFTAYFKNAPHFPYGIHVAPDTF